jgi:hypothetical protein
MFILAYSFEGLFHRWPVAFELMLRHYGGSTWQKKLLTSWWPKSKEKEESQSSNILFEGTPTMI